MPPPYGVRYYGFRRENPADPTAGESYIAKGKKLVTYADNTGTVTSEGATPNAVVMGRGTSASPLAASISSGNFLSYYFSATGTGSGDVRAQYLNLDLTPTSGESFRARTRFNGTGAVGVHGAHITAEISVGATITGQIVGLRATLGAAAASRTLGGTAAVLNLDSDIATGNTLSARTSFIRVTKSGAVDLTNFLDIADDQCLKGSAASGAATDALPVIMPDGSTLYISLIAAS